MADIPARITVARGGDGDVGSRQIHLSLDEASWATIAFGESATREVAPGRHVLRADNTLLRKTIAFEAGPGEHLRFTAGNRAVPGSWLFLMLGAPLLRVILTREP
jgi:hypothetical protein